MTFQFSYFIFALLFFQFSAVKGQDCECHDPNFRGQGNIKCVVFNDGCGNQKANCKSQGLGSIKDECMCACFGNKFFFKEINEDNKDLDDYSLITRVFSLTTGLELAVIKNTDDESFKSGKLYPLNQIKRFIIILLNKLGKLDKINGKPTKLASFMTRLNELLNQFNIQLNISKFKFLPLHVFNKEWVEFNFPQSISFIRDIFRSLNDLILMFEEYPSDKIESDILKLLKRELDHYRQITKRRINKG
jgi:hypothetical protein